MSNITKGEVTQDHASGILDAAGMKSRNFRFPYDAVGHLCLAIDAFVIIASSVLGCSIYQAVSSNTVNNFEAFVGAGTIGASLYIWMSHAAGFYEFTTIVAARRNYRDIFNRWITVGLLLTLLAFLFKVGAIFSRGSIVSFILLALVLLLISRWLAANILNGAVADGLVEGRRVVLVGSHEELAALNFASLLRDYGLTEVDRVALPNQKLSALQLNGPELSALDRAIKAARSKAADEIVLALSWSDSRRFDLIRDRMRSSPLPVQLLPDRIVRNLAANPSFVLKPSLSIEIQRGPLSRFEQFLKRGLDVVAAFIGLVLVAPPMLVIALIVKIDSPGPILFRQQRNGFNAKQFTIFKFRTMTVIEDGDNVVQATRFDQRITRVGRILRQSSLDELPQLFNVLRGDMSLVGPRPHALLHDSQYSELLSDYAFRHHVKPGITGWAQVNGFRGETSRVEQMRRRVDFDLWYINNWSLIFDIKILLSTCFEVVRARNAH